LELFSNNIVTKSFKIPGCSPKTSNNTNPETGKTKQTSGMKQSNNSEGPTHRENPAKKDQKCKPNTTPINQQQELEESENNVFVCKQKKQLACDVLIVCAQGNSHEPKPLTPLPKS
jgi:hypothetical protein